MLTWGWIDLLSSLPAITELRAFRIGRVLRILRFLRAARAARVVGSFWMGRRAQTTALVAVSVAILTVVGASIAVLYLERAVGGEIGSGAAALWWSFFTVMTGQQGDPFPVTAAGRAIGLALMTVGAALVGTLTATLVSWVIRPREDAKDSPTERDPGGNRRDPSAPRGPLTRNRARGVAYRRDVSRGNVGRGSVHASSMRRAIVFTRSESGLTKIV